MEENIRVRDDRTGLIYEDAVDQGDVYYGKRRGTLHYVRIPRSHAIEVGPEAMDEPVKKKKIRGKITQEELDRVRQEREGKKS